MTRLSKVFQRLQALNWTDSDSNIIAWELDTTGEKASVILSKDNADALSQTLGLWEKMTYTSTPLRPQDDNSPVRVSVLLRDFKPAVVGRRARDRQKFYEIPEQNPDASLTRDYDGLEAT